MTNFKIGCDPELFLTSQEDPDYVVSSIGKFGGSKDAPLQLANLENGFCIQEDNVALEFNIPPAASCEEFITSMSKAVTTIKDLCESKGLSPLYKASVNMPMSEIQDPRSWVFGCEPDYDAWTVSQNESPRSKDHTLRSAGGHIHIETPQNMSFNDKIEVIKFCDIVIGTVLSELDPDKTRMELYGKPGAHRIKSYGVEYRTPSNYWVDKPNLWKWVWLAGNKCVELVMQGKKVDANAYHSLVTRAIINTDTDARTTLYNTFGDWKSWFLTITQES